MQMLCTAKDDLTERECAFLLLLLLLLLLPVSLLILLLFLLLASLFAERKVHPRLGGEQHLHGQAHSFATACKASRPCLQQFKEQSNLIGDCQEEHR